MPRARLIVAAGLAVLTCAACEDTPSAAQAPPPASTSGAAPSSDQVVAEVAGRKITLADVDKKWQEFDAAERSRVTQLLYQNRRNMLDVLVGDALIEEAARVAKVTVEDYTQRELTRRSQPVTDADIQKFFDENKERAQGRTMAELRGPISEFLTSQRRQQARAQLVAELEAKSGSVRVLLDPPREVVEIASNDPVRGGAGAPVTIVEFSDYQ